MPFLLLQSERRKRRVAVQVLSSQSNRGGCCWEAGERKRSLAHSCHSNTGRRQPGLAFHVFLATQPCRKRPAEKNKQNNKHTRQRGMRRGEPTWMGCAANTCERLLLRQQLSSASNVGTRSDRGVVLSVVAQFWWGACAQCCVTGLCLCHTSLRWLTAELWLCVRRPAVRVWCAIWVTGGL